MRFGGCLSRVPRVVLAMPMVCGIMCGRRGGAPLRVALSRVIVALQLYLYRHEAHVLLACVRRGRINKRLGILAGGGWGMLAKPRGARTHNQPRAQGGDVRYKREGSSVPAARSPRLRGRLRLVMAYWKPSADRTAATRFTNPVSSNHGRGQFGHPAHHLGAARQSAPRAAPSNSARTQLPSNRCAGGGGRTTPPVRLDPLPAPVPVADFVANPSRYVDPPPLPRPAALESGCGTVPNSQAGAIAPAQFEQLLQAMNGLQALVMAQQRQLDAVGADIKECVQVEVRGLWRSLGPTERARAPATFGGGAMDAARVEAEDAEARAARAEAALERKEAECEALRHRIHQLTDAGLRGGRDGALRGGAQGHSADRHAGREAMAESSAATRVQAHVRGRNARVHRRTRGTPFREVHGPTRDAEAAPPTSRHGEQVLDVSATRVQSIARGRAARLSTARARGRMLPHEPVAELVDGSALDQAAAEEAARRTLQAGARGMQARRGLREQRYAAAELEAVEAVEELEAAAAATAIEEQEGLAATRVQAHARGRRARQTHGLRAGPPPADESEAFASDASAQEALAATRVQAHARGRRARQTLTARDGAPMEKAETAMLTREEEDAAAALEAAIEAEGNDDRMLEAEVDVDGE